MTIAFSGPGGLFTRLGKLFCAMQVINECTGETMPDSVNDALATYDPQDIYYRDIVGQTAQLAVQLPSSNQGISSNLQSVARNTLIAMVNEDQPQITATLLPSMTELIRQMVANGVTVDSTAVGASVSVVSAVGNGSVVVSVKRPDGLVNQNVFQESIRLTAQSTGGVGYAGELQASNPIVAGWPLGSGASGSLAVAGIGGSNILVNGSFESQTVTAGQPDNWIIDVGTPGTTVYLTDIEIQELTIAGTPASGTYLLNYEALDGEVWVTSPLPYNATSSQVQSALSALPGLGGVTVTSTGTSPNFTHTIVFTGVGGNLNELTVTNRLNTGTITPSTTQQGSDFVYSGGEALALESNGVQLITILQPITLNRLTQYAFGGYFAADPSGTGNVTVDLYDGLNTVEDEQGEANSLTFTVAGLSATYGFRSAVFRTPNVLPPQIYLRVRFSSVVSASTVVYADALSLVPMSQLYPGGVWASVFSGNIPFAVGDRFQIAATNSYTATFQEWFQRCFNMTTMAATGLMLPCASPGTISDSLACGSENPSSSSSP